MDVDLLSGVLEKSMKGPGETYGREVSNPEMDICRSERFLNVQKVVLCSLFNECREIEMERQMNLSVSSFV